MLRAFAPPAARALKTLLHGALLGVGAAIGFGLLYLAGWPNMEAEMQRHVADIRDSFEPAVSDLAISGVSEQRRGDSLRFVGVVANNGSMAADRIYVDIDFFAGRAFVDKCRQSVTVAAAPGQSRNFVVDCGPIAAHMPAYDRFELSLIGASARR